MRRLFRSLLVEVGLLGVPAQLHQGSRARLTAIFDETDMGFS